MVVKFYETTSGGQKRVGEVSYADGKLHGPQSLIELLLGRFATQLDEPAIKKLLSNSPSVFDGAYLRAEYSE